jgi:hypothetical protein
MGPSSSAKNVSKTFALKGLCHEIDFLEGLQKLNQYGLFVR